MCESKGPCARLAANVRIDGRSLPAIRLVISPHGSSHMFEAGDPLLGLAKASLRAPGTSHAPPPHAPTTLVHANGPGLVTFSRSRPGPSQVNDPDYSRKFMPKSMAPSASRKSSDTEPSPKSASE